MVTKHHVEIITRLPVAPLVVVAVSLLTSALLAAVIWTYNPNYLHDPSACKMPDAGAYLGLGRNLLDYGQYSRSPAEPYLPEFLYPPAYPFFVGILERLSGAAAIYVAQALLRAASCLLVYLAAKAAINERAGFWAGIFLGTDVYPLVYSFLIMSETLFVFFLTAGLALTLPILSRPHCATRFEKLRLAAGGCLLGLATLTRPQGLYAPLVAAICCCVIALYARALYARCLRRGLRHAGIMLGAACAVSGAWFVRDALIFSKPFVTSDIMLVYFAGASSYQIQYGISMEEAQDRIAQEFHLPPLQQMCSPHKFGRDLPGIIEDMRAISSARFAILFRHPAALTYSTVLGMLKVNVGHPVGEAAMMIDRPWVNPGTKRMLFSPLEAWNRVLQNPMPLVAMFAFHVGFIPVFLLLAAGGILGTLRNRSTRPAAILLLAVMGYFYLTVAMGGCGTVDRYRMPAFLFLSIFAGWAASRVIELVQHRRRTAAEAQPAISTST